MLYKNEIPILEYDDAREAVLVPNRNEHYRFPQYAAFAFVKNECENYAQKHACEMIGEYKTITKTYPIFKTVFNEREICFMQAPLGSSASAQVLDFLIACGVQYVISTGTCGTLVKRDENEFLIPLKALRDEGTSYHYLPKSRYITLNKAGVRAIEKTLVKRSIPFSKVNTWTTDGIYRETKDMIAYRKKEGLSTVEMECAALAAVAEFRNIVFAQLLFTADSLADLDNHDDRNWGKDSHEKALSLCFEILSEL